MPRQPALAAASLTAVVLALLSARAHADSACWPEAKLIGTTATGFVPAAKVWALSPAAQDRPAPADAVPTWTREGRPSKPLPCEQIATFNGECRDDYAYVPLWGNAATPRLEARTTGGEAIWLKADTREGPPGHAVITRGRRGELVNPEGAPLRATHSEQATPAKATAANEAALLAFMQRHDPKRSRAQLQALLRGEASDNDTGDGWHRQVRVQAFAQQADGLWMQLTETWAWSPADTTTPPQPGPTLRTGWLRHRDAEGKLLTVVQDDGYCD